uniref:Uncharacterized protein n=1 Tax=Pygoscelis antarcticus TaxID=79643 RepID=A0A7G7LKJ9_PYGAN|nr:hypothetical protein [Pygoscelis antarcticus]
MKNNNDSLFPQSEITRELVKERRPVFFTTMLSIAVIAGILSVTCYVLIQYLQPVDIELAETMTIDLLVIGPYLASFGWACLAVTIFSSCLAVAAVAYGYAYWPRPRYKIWNEMFYFLSDLDGSLRYKDVYDRFPISIKRISDTRVDVYVDYAGFPLSRQTMMDKLKHNNQFFKGAHAFINPGNGHHVFSLEYGEVESI